MDILVQFSYAYSNAKNGAIYRRIYMESEHLGAIASTCDMTGRFMCRSYLPSQLAKNGAIRDGYRDRNRCKEFTVRTDMPSQEFRFSPDPYITELEKFVIRLRLGNKVLRDDPIIVDCKQVMSVFKALASRLNTALKNHIYRLCRLDVYAGTAEKYRDELDVLKKVIGTFSEAFRRYEYDDSRFYSADYSPDESDILTLRCNDAGKFPNLTRDSLYEAIAFDDDYFTITDDFGVIRDFSRKRFTIIDVAL